jgi:hypothetical protein
MPPPTSSLPELVRLSAALADALEACDLDAGARLLEARGRLLGVAVPPVDSASEAVRGVLAEAARAIQDAERRSRQALEAKIAAIRRELAELGTAAGAARAYLAEDAPAAAVIDRRD